MALDFRYQCCILSPLLLITLGSIFYPGIGAEKSWDACMNSSDIGTKCGNYSIKWYYEEKEQTCQMFWYGGCDGNDNRFDSQDECMDHCKPDTKGRGRFFSHYTPPPLHHFQKLNKFSSDLS